MEAVQTRTLLGKGVQFFLAQTYSEDFKPIDIFVHSAIEFDATLEGEEVRIIGTSGREEE